MKRLLFNLLCLICIIFTMPSPKLTASTNSNKELNFVFLHGFNSNAGAMQILADSIDDILPAYIANYQSEKPGAIIESEGFIRSYPNNVSIETWAKNIADNINNRFTGKQNLVLIGHSMGGKTALYAVAHNIGNITDKVAMVVTVNSPIKPLSDYFLVGGDTALGYMGAQLVLPDQGILNSVANYDSSADGKWVADNKHWLAFISSESAPMSTQFNNGGIDALPRDMDDVIVPISCQYADGADVVYYGEYEHRTVNDSPQVANYIADQILRYVFGGNIKFAAIAREGYFQHKAGLFPGTDRWQDIVGGVLANSGSITHYNASYFKWQEWEDIVGEYSSGSLHSSFQSIQKISSFLFTGIREIRWASPDNPEDGRLYIKTRAAPRSSVQIDWSVYQQGLLPVGIERNHYEVEIVTGTQVTGIAGVTWLGSDPRDIRLVISSQASRPFNWFLARWRIYYSENREMRIMDSLS